MELGLDPEAMMAEDAKGDDGGYSASTGSAVKGNKWAEIYGATTGKVNELLAKQVNERDVGGGKSQGKGG